LTPAQPPPVSVLPSAYPGLSYQAPSFYPVPYTNVSLPHAAYAHASVPQPSTAILRNFSDFATANTPSTVKIYDKNRKYSICSSEQHLSSCCPSKVPSTTNVPQASNKNNNPALNDRNEPCRYCKKPSHTVRNCYKLANKNVAEETNKGKI